jgi:hypothetical protein
MATHLGGCTDRIASIVLENSFFVEILEEQKLAKALNGKNLKKYYPSEWGACSNIKHIADKVAYRDDNCKGQKV